jgi:hypothetical protein
MRLDAGQPRRHGVLGEGATVSGLDSKVEHAPS